MSPEGLEGLVESVDVVSFDVFDTLVCRPFVRPTDLFMFMEERYQCKGFHDARILAERTARRRVGPEITISDIYDHIDPQYAGFMDVEVDMESRLCLPDPGMMGVLDSVLSSDRTVVLVSDMYLPGSILSDIVDRCSIRHDGLYVSCDHGCSKHDGGLFDVVLDDLDIEPSCMLHIGDNRHADYRVPVSKGMRAFRYEPMKERYLGSHPDHRRFLGKGDSVERSVIVAMDAEHVCGGDASWYDIGYRYGGPMLYAYANHLSGRIPVDSLVLFTSRDCYTLKTIMERSFDIVHSEYVDLQRILSYVLTDRDIPYGRLDLPSRLTDRYIHDRNLSHMRYILGFFRDELSIGEMPAEPGSVEDLYNSNISYIDSLRRERYVEFRDDLRGRCDGYDDIHLVDCTTMKYSSQRLAEDVLGRAVTGHYFVTIKDDPSLRYDSFYRKRGPMIGWTRINVPEFFMSSPEPPMISWRDGSAVADPDPPEWERYRCSIYGEVSKGMIDYTDRMLEVFGDTKPSMSHGSVVAWSLLSSASGSREREYMDMIRWASGPDHSDWMNLIPRLSDVPSMVKDLGVQFINIMNRAR